MENANNVVPQIIAAPGDVQTYLHKEFKAFLQNPLFEEGIIAHIDPYNASQAFERIINIMNEVVKGSD